MNLVTGSFGGTMELTSEKNKGVRFEVRFPAQATMINDPMHTAVLTAQTKRIRGIQAELSEVSNFPVKVMIFVDSAQRLRSPSPASRNKLKFSLPPCRSAICTHIG